MLKQAGRLQAKHWKRAAASWYATSGVVDKGFLKFFLR